MIINIICFISGGLLGFIGGYFYDYYRNMKEFNERQERYKKMF